jgi:hypothetical protein
MVDCDAGMSTVTCRTDECENNGIPIQLELTARDDEGRVQQITTVICGVCGQLITDIER